MRPPGRAVVRLPLILQVSSFLHNGMCKYGIIHSVYGVGEYSPSGPCGREGGVSRPCARAPGRGGPRRLCARSPVGACGRLRRLAAGRRPHGGRGGRRDALRAPGGRGCRVVPRRAVRVRRRLGFGGRARPHRWRVRWRRPGRVGGGGVARPRRRDGRRPDRLPVRRVSPPPPAVGDPVRGLRLRARPCGGLPVDPDSPGAGPRLLRLPGRRSLRRPAPAGRCRRRRVGRPAAGPPGLGGPDSRDEREPGAGRLDEALPLPRPRARIAASWQPPTYRDAVPAGASSALYLFADAAGCIAARWTYDAWGNVLSEEVAPGAGELRAVRYRFQGRERSAATGLVHFRVRWYDPATGRWLSPDPIGLEGGLNLHAFCGNDPVNYTDPSGLCSDETPELPMIGGLGPSRYGPSGRAYRADAFGYGKNPRTGLPNDSHIHQQYGNGPDRIFNIDQTPRDRGPKVSKRDIGAFLKAVDDLIRRVGGRLTTFPVMFLPAIWLEPPDESGRLML